MGHHQAAGTAKWTYYYLYVILDIFSRYTVGWMLAHRESSDLASRLIRETLHKQNVSVATRQGISSSTIQAPSRNLVTAKTSITTPVQTAPKPLSSHLEPPAGLVAKWSSRPFDLGPGAGGRSSTSGGPCRPATGVNERNTPMAYSGIRAVTLALKDDDQQRGDERQGHDAPRIDQPAAAIGELPRQEAVLAQQGAQAGKAGKGGVGGHDQDDRGGGDGAQVQQRPGRRRPCAPAAR